MPCKHKLLGCRVLSQIVMLPMNYIVATYKVNLHFEVVNVVAGSLYDLVLLVS